MKQGMKQITLISCKTLWTDNSKYYQKPDRLYTVTKECVYGCLEQNHAAAIEDSSRVLPPPTEAKERKTSLNTESHSGSLPKSTFQTFDKRFKARNTQFLKSPNATKWQFLKAFFIFAEAFAPSKLRTTVKQTNCSAARTSMILTFCDSSFMAYRNSALVFYF